MTCMSLLSTEANEGRRERRDKTETPLHRSGRKIQQVGCDERFAAKSMTFGCFT